MPQDLILPSAQEMIINDSLMYHISCAELTDCASITVSDGTSALFMINGICDNPRTAGRYAKPSINPFSVLCVLERVPVQLKWGTRGTPLLQARGARYQLRGNGTISLRITNANRFAEKLSFIETKISDFMPEKGNFSQFQEEMLSVIQSSIWKVVQCRLSQGKLSETIEYTFRDLQTNIQTEINYSNELINRGIEIDNFYINILSCDEAIDFNII